MWKTGSGSIELPKRQHTHHVLVSEILQLLQKARYDLQIAKKKQSENRALY